MRQALLGLALTANVAAVVSFSESVAEGVAFTCDSTAPGCGGTCPDGQACTSLGFTCVCRPTCGQSAPECDGVCPGGQQCTSLGSLNCFCAAFSTCGQTFPECNGTCPTGQECIALGFGCFCGGGQTPTATATAPAAATPTTTGQPGTGCTDPSQCATGFCVEGVCCTTACDGPGEICPNGVCSMPAAAPAASPSGLAFGIVALGAIAGVALWRRRRDDRGKIQLPR